MNPALRTAVIAEWRGLPERKMRPDRWQCPAELMPRLMQRLGLRERLRETEVIDAWSKIVGDFIAAHSTPVALRRRDSVRPGSSTCIALRARTNLQARNPAKTKTTLRQQNHSRRPLPRRLKGAVFLRQFLL